MSENGCRRMVLETPAEMALNVAKRFRETRRAKKMTLKELSERSGVPYSTVRRFEAKGEISFAAFVKLTSTIGEDAQIQALFAKKTPQTIEEVIRGNRR